MTISFISVITQHIAILKLAIILSEFMLLIRYTKLIGSEMYKLLIGLCFDEIMEISHRNNVLLSDNEEK